MNEQAVNGLFTEMLDLLMQYRDLLLEAGQVLRQDTEDLTVMAHSLEELRKENRYLTKQISEWRKLNETLNKENDSLMKQNRELLSLQNN